MRSDRRALARHVSGDPSELTDAERMVLLRMTMLAIAEWSGCTLEEAADALDELAGRGGVHSKATAAWSP